MIGEWTKWEPIDGLSPKYHLESLSDDLEGFRIRLSDYYDKNKQVLITFKHTMEVYRNTNESYRLKLMNDLSIKYSHDFYGKWTFFKITNSPYLKWLREEAAGVCDDDQLIHFCFVLADSFVEAIDGTDPKVEFI